MIHNTVRAFVETRLREFNGQHEGLLILYEDQPDNHVDGEPFMSVWTIFGNTLRKSIGKTPHDELIGFVQIDALVLIGTGLGEAKRRAEEFSECLSAQSFRLPPVSTINFRKPHVSTLKPFGGYQRVMSRVGFWVTLPSRV